MANNYNTTLQSNNTDLQAILSAINKLPEAGGEQATPVISVNNSNGLIIATAGTKSSTYQMAFQPAQTITPGTTNKTIAANTYLGGVQTIKGDANLVASNIVSGKSIFGVVGIASVGGGGNTSVEDAMITGTSMSYTNNRVTTIGNYAFYGHRLTAVSFPEVTTIGVHAFCGCEILTSISFPKVTTIGSSAFQSCRRLTSASFPEAISISSYAFDGCTQLTTVSFPKVAYIAHNAFEDCKELTTVSFSEVTSINAFTFYSCWDLTTVSFPKVTTINTYAFAYCSKLTTVSFPKVTTIDTYAFYACISLTTIYLTASSLCTLANSNAFSNTSIWSNKGSIFVPTSLASKYKSATNWAFFSARIFGI